MRIRLRKFLKGEPRHLRDDVVNRRLEGRRRDPSNVVDEFVQREADREFRRDFRNGETRRL